MYDLGSTPASAPVDDEDTDEASDGSDRRPNHPRDPPGRAPGGEAAQTNRVRPATISLRALALFLRIESRNAAPLVTLRLFRQRGVVAGGLGQRITAGIMLPCFFMRPLSMQSVLGYTPMETAR